MQFYYEPIKLKYKCYNLNKTQTMTTECAWDSVLFTVNYIWCLWLCCNVLLRCVVEIPHFVSIFAWPMRCGAAIFVSRSKLKIFQGFCCVDTSVGLANKNSLHCSRFSVFCSMRGVASLRPQHRCSRYNFDFSKLVTA